MNSNKWCLKVVILVLCFLFIALFFGCNGGTRGSGGNIVQGTVSRTLNPSVPAMLEPFSGLSVLILETGASAITDENGLYVIQSRRAESNVAFSLQAEDVDILITVEDLPVDSPQVTVNFNVDVETNSAVTTLIDVTEPNQNSSSNDDDDSDDDDSNGDDDDDDDSNSEEDDDSGDDDDDSSDDDDDSDGDDDDDDSSDS